MGSRASNQEANYEIRPRLRIITKNTAQTQFNMRRYFTQERKFDRRKNLKNPVLRAIEATGVSRKIICLLKSQLDVDKWENEEDHTEHRQRQMDLPLEWWGIVRGIIRDMFLYKTKTSVTRIYESLTCSEAPRLQGAAWTWSRSALHRFTGCIGYCFNDRKTHYEYTKERTDVVCMRENYLEWIKKYRNEEFSMKHGCVRILPNQKYGLIPNRMKLTTKCPVELVLAQ